MPIREKGEKLSHFISRFVGSGREERKFPNIKQRLAVGYSEAKRESARSKKHGN